MTYTSDQAAQDAQRFAELIRSGHYPEVDNLDTAALAQAILDGLGSIAGDFCGHVATNLWRNDAPVRFVMGTNDGVMSVLGLPPGATVLTFAPAFAMGSGPQADDNDRLEDMWRNTHYFRVTLDGIRYAGQVTYQQMLERVSKR